MSRDIEHREFPFGHHAAQGSLAIGVGRIQGAWRRTFASRAGAYRRRRCRGPLKSAARPSAGRHCASWGDASGWLDL